MRGTFYKQKLGTIISDLERIHVFEQCYKNVLSMIASQSTKNFCVAQSIKLV